MDNKYGQRYIPTSKDDKPLTGTQILVWIFAWVALVLDVMYWQLLSVAASNVLTEFKFTKSSMGLLLGAPLLGAGIGGLLSGWFSDKFGRARVMVYCLIWYSVFTVAFAFSNSYEMMLFLRIMVGLGLGAVGGWKYFSGRNNAFTFEDHVFSCNSDWFCFWPHDSSICGKVNFTSSRMEAAVFYGSYWFGISHNCENLDS